MQTKKKKKKFRSKDEKFNQLIINFFFYPIDDEPLEKCQERFGKKFNTFIRSSVSKDLIN